MLFVYKVLFIIDKLRKYDRRACSNVNYIFGAIIVHWISLLRIASSKIEKFSIYEKGTRHDYHFDFRKVLVSFIREFTEHEFVSLFGFSNNMSATFLNTERVTKNPFRIYTTFRRGNRRNDKSQCVINHDTSIFITSPVA